MNESLNTFLSDLGITAKHLVAGFFGGSVYAFIKRNISAWEALSSVLVGTFTANYLTEYASRAIGIGDGAAGFVIGLTAMIVCQTIVETAKKWKPKPAGGADAS